MGKAFINNRIKYYRELLNVTQKELGGEILSEALIQSIESKTNKLSIKTASIIANNLNKMGENRGIKLGVSANELLKPAKVCAREYCEKIIIEAEKNDSMIDINKEIVSLAKKFKLYDIEMVISKKMGYYCYKNNMNREAIEYFENYVALCKLKKNNIETAEILNLIGKNYIYLEYYDKALKNFKKSLNNLKGGSKENKELFIKINYNVAYTLNKLKRFDECLKYLHKLLKINNLEKKSMYDVQILLAHTYTRQNKYKDALSIYESLFNEYSNDYLLAHNMSIVNYKIGNEEESKKYLDKALNMQMNSRNCDISFSFRQCASLHNNNKNYKGAIRCLQYAINNCNRFNQEEIMINSYKDLYKIWKIYGEEPLKTEFLDSIYKNLDILTKNEWTKSELLLVLIDFIMEYEPNDKVLLIIEKLKE